MRIHEGSGSEFARDYVFADGHDVSRCERETLGDCACQELYEEVFGRCHKCGDDLDELGLCSDGCGQP